MADLDGCFAGEPLTQHQLDRLCEKNLKQIFGEAVDFALENSLPVLIEYGLVKQDTQVRLPMYTGLTHVCMNCGTQF